jgi:hypothetical protein
VLEEGEKENEIIGIGKDVNNYIVSVSMKIPDTKEKFQAVYDALEDLKKSLSQIEVETK